MQKIYVGVDTHSDFHVAVALDFLGRYVSELTFSNTSDGHADLLRWSSSLGEAVAFGIEGTGSYGATLANTLAARGFLVLEVSRPNRQTRRRLGKSDLTDAESAARSLLAGLAFSPKLSRGPIDSLRILKLVRSSAIKARTQTMNQLRSVLVTGPLELVEDLRGEPVGQILAKCSSYSISRGDSYFAVRLALKTLAERHQFLSSEIAFFDAEILSLVQSVSPALLQVYGVGPDVASSLLVAIGESPFRLRSESSFAHLCGVAPLPASSGKTQRHRLNRGGNRDANRALHRVAVTRMIHDPRTASYVLRRLSEGKSKREIIRCLKRYIARELFKVIRIV